MARFEGPLYCTRCGEHREVTAPWPHWPMVRRVYLGLPLLALPALPIMLSDVFVMTPMVTAYLFGIGPLLGTRSLMIKCCDCGAIVDPAAPAPVPLP